MNIFQIFKSRRDSVSVADEVQALVRAAAREIATEAAREALVEPTAQLLQIMQSPGFTRRGEVPSVLAYNSNMYAMNDPQRFRDYADPRMRPYSTVNVDTLRTLARSYDVLASCITHLKSEVIKTPVKVVARDAKDSSAATKRALADAQAFMGPRGGLGGSGMKRAEFEGKLLDDVLVIGAGALFLDYETIGSMRDENPDYVVAIDASTIRPLLTDHGFMPDCGRPAYEQVVQGQSVATLSRSELIYEGLPIFAQTHTPYFLSAVELLVMTIFTALKCDEWNRTWLTDGNVPDRLITAPKEWTPDQIREYTNYFDDLLAGDSRARHKVRIVPEGTTLTEQSRKDADFQEFEFWMRDRTCSVMGVNPASIGHHSRQYQSSQSAAMDSTAEGRVAQLLEWRRSVYDDILERKGWGCLQTIDDLPREEDARARAERHQIEIRSGLRTINETRKEDGLEPSSAEGTEILLVGGGLVPLEQVVKPPAGGDGDDEPDPPAPGKTPVDEVSPESKDDSGDKQASAEARESDPIQNVERALKQWERKSLNRLARGKSASCGFVCPELELSTIQQISERLDISRDKAEVAAVFQEARELVRFAEKHRSRGRTTSNPHNTAGSFAPEGAFDGGADKIAASDPEIVNAISRAVLQPPSPEKLTEGYGALKSWHREVAGINEAELQISAAEQIARLAGDRGLSEKFQKYITLWGKRKTTSDRGFSPAEMISLQMAASEELEVPLGHLSKVASEPGMLQYYERNRADMRKLVRFMYLHTQQALAERGIENIVLWRGMKSSVGVRNLPSAPGFFTGKMKLQPINSFSWNPYEAFDFAGRSGAVVIARVPRQRILGTAITGFGILRQSEAAVLGRISDSVHWIVWDHTENADYYRGLGLNEWRDLIRNSEQISRGIMISKKNEGEQEENPPVGRNDPDRLYEVDADELNANWLCKDFWDEEGRYIGPGSTEEDRTQLIRLKLQDELDELFESQEAKPKDSIPADPESDPNHS